MPRFPNFICALSLLVVLTVSNHAVFADTREALLKRTVLNNTHREMFAVGDFAKLDRGMNDIQLAYEKGQWTDTELWKLFNRPLGATDPAFEGLYNKWILAYPKSYAARQARGAYFLNRVIVYLEDARATTKIRKIEQLPQEQALEIKRLLQLSLRDNLAAQKLTAKPFLAYYDLMGVYGFVGALDKSANMLEEANKIAPNNMMARFRYMLVLAENDRALSDMQKVMDDVHKNDLADDDIPPIANFVHARLLKDASYEQLDREINKLQQDYEAGKIDDVTLNAYFMVFDNLDPALKDNYAAWIKLYPKSYAAHQGLTRYLVGLAGQARGDRYIKDTSDKEVGGMQLYLNGALENAKVAITLTAKPVLSYRSIILISAFRGATEDSTKAFEMANKIDPKNYMVRDSYMFGLQTKWGGSLEQMEDLLKNAKAAGVSDYRLMGFEKMIEVEKIWLANRISDNYSNIGKLLTGF